MFVALTLWSTHTSVSSLHSGSLYTSHTYIPTTGETEVVDLKTAGCQISLLEKAKKRSGF